MPGEGGTARVGTVPAALHHPFRVVVFDRDGTAVPDRHADAAAARDRVAALVREFLGRLACRCAVRPAMRLVVAAGEPPGAILRAARDTGADLVVMAWGGTFEGARAATMRGVLAGTTVPVMVMRAA